MRPGRIDRAVAQQAIEHDEAGVSGDLVRTGRAADQARGLAKSTHVRHGFAILVRGHEARRQARDRRQTRSPLQAVGLIAADLDLARGHGAPRSSGAMPASSHTSLTRVSAGRRARGHAAAHQIIEVPGRSPCSNCAAPANVRSSSVANETVEMRRPRVNAEVARGGAFQVEPRRCRKARSDRIALVPPCGKRTFAGKLRRDLGKRGTALGLGGEFRNQRRLVRVDAKHASEFRQPAATLGREPADNDAFDAQRKVVPGRWRQDPDQAPMQRVECGTVDHQPILNTAMTLDPPRVQYCTRQCHVC